jgi:hypothetical protein
VAFFGYFMGWVDGFVAIVTSMLFVIMWLLTGILDQLECRQ